MWVEEANGKEGTPGAAEWADLGDVGSGKPGGGARRRKHSLSGCFRGTDRKSSSLPVGSSGTASRAQGTFWELQGGQGVQSAVPQIRLKRQERARLQSLLGHCEASREVLA